jgi:elongation factor P
MSNAARQICLVASVKLVSWSWSGGPIGEMMHTPDAESARDRERDRGENGVPFPGRSSGAGSGRCYSRSAMAATTTNDLKRGMTLDLSEGLFQVVDFQHVKPGKGPAFVRTTLRNVRTGGVLDRTFRSDERVEQAMVEKKEMQLLYRDGTDYVFMDNDSYDQVPVDPKALGDAVNYLVDSDVVQLQFYKDEIIGTELPAAVELTVTETEPGIQGDRVSGARKPATVETGLVVQVPLFVNQGERIKVDTRSGEYLTRA